jgi:transcriptional regulator with XRE-family HTH domain
VSDIEKISLAQLRESKELSQEQLAEQTGISLEKIQAFENGTEKPRGSGAGNIATALGVDVFMITELLGM